MKKTLIVFSCLFCLMGCTVQEKEIEQPQIEEKQSKSNEEKAIDAAVAYLDLEKVPEKVQITKDKYSEKRASLVFEKEMEIDEEFYIVDLEIYDDRMPGNAIVLVSASTFETVGYGLVD